MAKKSIVVKYVSMWPRAVCDLHRSQQKQLFVRRMPELQKPGVYILYRDDHPYYIGRADNLARRIWHHANHPNSKYYHFWNMFSAFTVSEKKYVGDVEGILIASYPSANSSVPRFPKLKLPSDIVLKIRKNRQFASDLLDGMKALNNQTTKQILKAKTKEGKGRHEIRGADS